VVARNKGSAFSSINQVRVIVITNKVDEKGTLKATKRDKYENIAGSVRLSLFMGSNGNACYYPRRLAPG
jgi:hypothetical protein